MTVRTRSIAVALILVLASPPELLFAAEQAPDAAVLPGVVGDYRIVKPAPPEPEPDDTAPDTARYGRWDVTVSGKFTIDVGAGCLPSPHGSGN